MIQLQVIQKKLLELNEIIKKHKSLLSIKPDNLSVMLALSSFESLYTDLQNQYVSVANFWNFNVVNYRLSSKHKNISISALSALLDSFQNLYSNVYEVVKYQVAKQNTRLRDDTVKKTALYFGYSYGGSLGIVMTIDNQEKFIESDLDIAFKQTLDVLKVKTKEEIKPIIDKFGYGTIKLLNDWSTVHLKYETNAEIKSSLSSTEQTSDNFVVSDIKTLNELLVSTPIITEEILEFVECQLVGVDIEKRTFHIIVDESKNYLGTLSEAIQDNFSVPSVHSVKIREEDTFFKGRNSKKYVLLSIN